MNKLTKNRYWVMVFVLAAVLGVGVLTNLAPTIAHAQVTAKTKSLKKAPKSLRGTWYHYYKSHGLYKVVIKKHRVSQGPVNGKLTTIPSLMIDKFYKKGKRTIYAFNSKTEPTDATAFAKYTMKIKGKKRHVLVMPQQGAGEKPTVFTRFKVKRAYFTPLSVQTHMA
ncbi:hypothetical protein [Lactiplantibacillus songbeiensis]|uniref:Cell surface protein n=1 Tax=Lactiplantibacillus songbeiensis TaxID=2559920 RepID=A0ABW4C1A4_9LACO|nr:hypothetical protein [Lactiplantibacillus songbeiensis]